MTDVQIGFRQLVAGAAYSSAMGRRRRLVASITLLLFPSLCGCSRRVHESSSAAGAGDGGTTGVAGGTDASPGSPSTNPKCTATPTQLVDFNVLAAQVNSFGIGAVPLAVDATNAYFVFGGWLWRLPLRGGSPSEMSAATPNLTQNNDPTPISGRVVFHHVVAGASNNEQIVSVPIEGGPATTLATTNGQVDAFAANDTAVYFVDQSGLQTVSVAGGSVQLLSDQVVHASGIAVVGANLVVTAGQMGGSIDTVISVPVAAGSPMTLATQQANASFPMACGMDVCWYTGAPPSPMRPTGPGYIARLANGQVMTILAQVYPWSLTFDGTDFFETVGCDGCSGTLVRIPSSGAPAISMVSAGFVAVDDECAYVSVALGFDLPWKSDAGGVPASGIYSVAKSYADPMLQTDM